MKRKMTRVLQYSRLEHAFDVFTPPVVVVSEEERGSAKAEWDLKALVLCV